MMMRRDVAVVARAVVQHRDLARLTDVAQGLERAMHGGERNMRMLLADGGENRVRARMVARVEQHFDNREALRRDGQAALAASIGKLREPFGRVRTAPPFIYEL